MRLRFRAVVFLVAMVMASTTVVWRMMQTRTLVALTSPSPSPPNETEISPQPPLSTSTPPKPQIHGCHPVPPPITPHGYKLYHPRSPETENLIRESDEAIYAYSMGRPYRPVRVVISTTFYSNPSELLNWPHAPSFFGVMQRWQRIAKLPNIELTVALYTTFDVSHWIERGFYRPDGTREPFSFKIVVKNRPMTGGKFIPFEKDRFFQRHIHEFDVFYYGEGDTCLTEITLHNWLLELRHFVNNTHFIDWGPVMDADPGRDWDGPADDVRRIVAYQPGFLTIEVSTDGRPISHGAGGGVEPNAYQTEIEGRKYWGGDHWIYSPAFIVTQHHAHPYFCSPYFPPADTPETRTNPLAYESAVHPGCNACMLDCTDCAANGIHCVHGWSNYEYTVIKLIPQEKYELFMVHHTPNKYAGSPPGWVLGGSHYEGIWPQFCWLNESYYVKEDITPPGGYKYAVEDEQAAYDWAEWAERDEGDVVASPSPKDEASPSPQGATEVVLPTAITPPPPTPSPTTPTTPSRDEERLAESDAAILAYARGNPTRPVRIVVAMAMFWDPGWSDATRPISSFATLQHWHEVGKLPNIELHAVIHSVLNITYWLDRGYVKSDGSREPFSFTHDLFFRPGSAKYFLAFAHERYFRRHFWDHDVFYYGEMDMCLTPTNVHAWLSEWRYFEGVDTHAPGFMTLEVRTDGDFLSHADDGGPKRPRTMELNGRAYYGGHHWMYVPAHIIKARHAYNWLRMGPDPKPEPYPTLLKQVEYNSIQRGWDLHPGCQGCFLGPTECFAFGVHCINSPSDWVITKLTSVEQFPLLLIHHMPNKYAGVPPAFELTKDEQAMAVPNQCNMSMAHWSAADFWPEGGIQRPTPAEKYNVEYVEAEWEED